MTFGANSKAPSPTAPRRRPCQSRSIMTVDAILEAAAILFARDGFDRVSTTRIADIAGVSIGSFYDYFPSKDALVAKLLKRQGDEMVARVEKSLISTEGQCLERVIDDLINVAYETYARDAKLHRVLLEQMGRVSKPHHIRRVSFALADLLEKALVSCGKEVSRPNVQLAAFLVESVVETLIQRLIQYGTVVGEDEFCLELKVMVVRYLSACTHDGRGSRR